LKISVYGHSYVKNFQVRRGKNKAVKEYGLFISSPLCKGLTIN
jgi:hypothetical protein